MKRIPVVGTLLILLALACNFGSGAVTAVTVVPATALASTSAPQATFTPAVPASTATAGVTAQRSPTSPPAATPTPPPTATPIPVTPGSVQVTYQSGSLTLNADLCVPEGIAPLPAVIYNHGGFGGQIGGAPAETCEALAQAGFVGFAPLRREAVALDGNLEDTLAAVDYVKELDYVDANRLGIMGFSRGGWLTFLVATQRPADFRAIVIMAAAPGILDQLGARAGLVSAPALLLVAENDDAPVNHVEVMRTVSGALEQAGKSATLIVYPPYENDGHQMFFEVGSYWSDVQQFLAAHLTAN